MDTGNHQDKSIFVVDRIVGEILVCEEISNKTPLKINKNCVSHKVKEGDLISFFKGKYKYEKKKTNERKEYMENLFESLL